MWLNFKAKYNINTRAVLRPHTTLYWSCRSLSADVVSCSGAGLHHPLWCYITFLIYATDTAIPLMGDFLHTELTGFKLH